MIKQGKEGNLFGLTQEEVFKSREKKGDNILTPPKRTSPWKLYFEKFKDPVIKILIVASALSLIISILENQYVETIGIITAILLSTGISFIFEYNAKRRFHLLNIVNDDLLVKVVRNGQVHKITRKEVVVGDIVLLETGDEIPADGILIKSVSMKVNESMLTGELIVEKTVYEERFDKGATYPSNHLMRGTTLVEGYGTMEVKAVGDATEIGHVAKRSMEQTEVETPLNIQLKRFAKLISRIGFWVASLAFLIFVMHDLYVFFVVTKQFGWYNYMALSRQILEYFMMAVTLIVVAVPEGLPMSVALSLALNMRRMLKTNNLVRSLQASETMGAINVICTDKTGTLTENKMKVQVASFNGKDVETLGDDEVSRLIVENLAANTTAFLDITDDEVQGVGNPTEVALLLWLHDKKFDYLNIRKETSLVSQITFSPDRKFMATIVDSGLFPGKRILYMKGASEILLSHCSDALIGGEKVDLEICKVKIIEWLSKAQGKAMRTLGFAYKIVDEDSKDIQTVIDGGGLTFLGTVAIADPIRADIIHAVDECCSAGIEIKIVTGDTQITAKEIAKQIGLWDDAVDSDINIISGPVFAAMGEEEALTRIHHLKIISRARPADKQRLVQLLQSQGAVVAVTGDGTNDAPALHHAHVGLSMGSGTSVAKEASDITLLDDSFASISTAVMWGRSLYKNIQRFITFQLTINLVALCIELIGSFIGTELPLTITQMLWINLIMDTFASLALSSIPPSKEVMKEKPRKLTDFIITKFMRNNIIVWGVLFMIALILIYPMGASSTLYSLTVFFTVFVVLQFWNLFNIRMEGTSDSIFHVLSHSGVLLFVALVILLGQVVIVQFGGNVFRTQPLSFDTWFVIFVSTSSVLWIGELSRLYQRINNKRNERKEI